jgi:putative addiction module CopG family antidote
MVSISLSSKLRKLIAKEMDAGRYESEDELLADALQALAERRSAIEGIRRGLEDMKAGRMRSWKECKRDLRKRHPRLAEE